MRGPQTLSLLLQPELPAGLPSGVIYFNTFAFMHEVVADPSAFGFTNVDDCLV